MLQVYGILEESSDSTVNCGFHLIMSLISVMVSVKFRNQIFYAVNPDSGILETETIP